MGYTWASIGKYFNNTWNYALHSVMHYAVHFALFYALHYVLLYTVQYAIHFALLTERTTALWAVYGHLFITTKLSRQTTTWRWRSQETMGNKVFELSTKNIMLLDM